MILTKEAWRREISFGKTEMGFEDWVKSKRTFRNYEDLTPEERTYLSHPLILVQPSVQVPNPNRRGGLRPTFRHFADNGVAYLSNTLAVVIGFADHSGFYQRLKKLRYSDPRLLMPPAKKGRKLNGEPCGANDVGTDEWRALGNKVRNHNLSKIKNFGSWEAQNYA